MLNDVFQGIQEYLQHKINFLEPGWNHEQVLNLLKLNTWFTLNVLETVEHS